MSAHGSGFPPQVAGRHTSAGEGNASYGLFGKKGSAKGGAEEKRSTRHPAGSSQVWCLSRRRRVDGMEEYANALP
jgi:hypothetical protein